ncbi:MAG: serine O-acetyltransferase [Oscillospiraceae bacterium]|jgi:serine O-acetyltransferase|nr:serine O-acetyltransferase [Oscillospiraceae bacterium]
MFKGLRADIRSIRERDPAARSGIEVFLLYSGLHALIYYRISHRLYLWRLKFLARWVSQLGKFFTGVEIHPAAKIGRGLFIDHGEGIVIGETTEIGDYVTLYQGVTLGGTGKDAGKRHPTIGNNVLIGAGAKVLGPFKVGDGTKIAANAVVLTELPENVTAVGVPAKIVRVNGMKTGDETGEKPGGASGKSGRDDSSVYERLLDHIHTPDPVLQEIESLRAQVERLEKMVAAARDTDNN